MKDNFLEYDMATTDSNKHQRTRYTAHYRTNSMAEINWLPMTTCAQFLDQVYQSSKVLFIVLWLILTTGINPNRFARILINPSPSQLNDTNIGIDTRTWQLVYRIQHRDTNAKTSMIKRWMALEMPQSLLEPLTHLSPEFCSAIKGKLKYQAMMFSRTHPGMTPTAERIRITGTRERTGLNSLVRAMLSGAINVHLKGRAHYVIPSSWLLHQWYYDAVQKLLNALNRTGNNKYQFLEYLDSLKPWPRLDPDPDPGAASAAMPLSLLQEETRLLTDRIRTLQNQTSFLHQDLRLQPLIDVVNALFLKYYCLLQSAVGLRPIGKVARLMFANPEHGCLKIDKASAYSREHSLTFLAPSIPSLLEDIKQYRRALIAVARCQGICFVEALPKTEKERGPLPHWVELDPGKNKIMERLMRGTDATRLMKAFGLTQLATKNNRLRHTVAAYLFDQGVSESLFNIHMTHNAAATFPYRNSSSFSLTALEELHRKIELFLYATGLPHDATVSRRAA